MDKIRTDYVMDEAMEQVLGILTPSNRLVMRVILHTGLRVGDVLELRPWQIARQFWITEQKTKKRRRVGLSDDLIADLRENSNEKWCFPARTGDGHRTRQAVWWDVKRAARAYRLSTNIGTHSGRKVYAVKLMRKYGDVEKVRKALNHSSVLVTVLYACADTLVEEKRRKHRYSRRL